MHRLCPCAEAREGAVLDPSSGPCAEAREGVGHTVPKIDRGWPESISLPGTSRELGWVAGEDGAVWSGPGGCRRRL